MRNWNHVVNGAVSDMIVSLAREVAREVERTDGVEYHVISLLGREGFEDTVETLKVALALHVRASIQDCVALQMQELGQ